MESNQHHIEWIPCCDLPHKLYAGSVAVSADSKRVYVTAWDAPEDDTYNNVYCYDISCNQWTVLPQPGHCFGVLHMLDDRLTIFGGNDIVTDEVLQKVTTYNNDTNSWYRCYPDMLSGRFKPGVITYNNHVIVMGGLNGFSIQDSIEVMDCHDQLKWIKASFRLPLPMWGIKPTITGDNITIAGYYNSGCKNECYQVKIKSTSSADKPLFTGESSKYQWKKLSSATYYNTVTVPYSNPPVIIGGHSEYSIPTPDIMLYDTSINLWKKVGSLTSARFCVGVGTINNSTIIVIGGSNRSEHHGRKAALACSLTTVEIGVVVPNQ